MSEPLVSVLLPVRDAGAYLGQCIASLARQTLADFEVVAVDDGSADGSAAVLDGWAARDPRLSVIHRRRRGWWRPSTSVSSGAAAPSWRGWTPTTSVTRADSSCRSAAREDPPWVGVVSCLVRHFPRAGWVRVSGYERWLNPLTTPEAIARERFVESPLAHPSAAGAARALRGGGLPRPQWPEDYDLWLRLLEARSAFAKVDRSLYFWREHPERLTRRDCRYSVEPFLRCKAHYLLRGPLAGCGRVVIWGAGQTGRRLSSTCCAAEARIEAFVDIDPAKIGRTARAPDHRRRRAAGAARPGPWCSPRSSRGAREPDPAAARRPRAHRGRRLLVRRVETLAFDVRTLHVS